MLQLYLCFSLNVDIAEWQRGKIHYLSHVRVQALPQCILVNVVQDTSMDTPPLGCYWLRRFCGQIKQHGKRVFV